MHRRRPRSRSELDQDVVVLSLPVDSGRWRRGRCRWAPWRRITKAKATPLSAMTSRSKRERVSRGTEGSQIRRWRELDSNHRSRRERRPSREARGRPSSVSRDDLCLMTPSSSSVRHLPSAAAKRPFARAGPMVRIRCPPARSQCQTAQDRVKPSALRPRRMESWSIYEGAPQREPELKPGPDLDLVAILTQMLHLKD